MKTELYVCWHKEPPAFESDILRPINAAYNQGNNIADKGIGYSELRIMYWIWKNTAADVVGLFHYRRFLNLQNKATKACGISKNFALKYGLTAKRVEELMQTYDVILPKKVPERVKPNTPTVYDYYAKAHYQEDLDVAMAVLKEKYPQMTEIAEDTLKNSYQSYTANLIIAKKAIFDEYAAWLFDILFEVERRIAEKVKTREPYQQRVYGFLSERLLGIFINEKKARERLNILEAPLLNIEPGKTKYFCYTLRQLFKTVLNKTVQKQYLKKSFLEFEHSEKHKILWKLTTFLF